MTKTRSRRLRQYALISINGVASTPLAWAGPYFGEGSVAHSLQALRECGGFLMGRRTYEIFAQQWPTAPGEYAAAMNAIPKIVFSNTLDSATWHNTTIVRSDVISSVATMKAEAGLDLLVYGHGQFGQTLVDAGLVDELTLTVVPVFADGEPFFRRGSNNSSWELVRAGTGSDPGLAALTYRKAS